MSNSNAISVFIDNFNIENGLLTIRGYLEGENLTEIKNKLKLKIQKRKTEIFYQFPIRIEENRWEATIDYNQNDYPRGYWDYYLVYNQDIKYRIKIKDNSITKANYILLFKNKNVSKEMHCYTTKKGSFSTISKTTVISISDLSGVFISEHEIKITGNLKLNELISKKNLIEAKFIVKDRKSNHKSEEEIIFNEINDSEVELEVNINYDKIILNKPEKKRWDIYIKIPINGVDFLFRMQITASENLETDTLHEFKRDKTIYQIYLYPTVNNNLSIVLTDLKIIRDVVSYSFTKKELRFKGYAYFDLVNFDRPDNVNRSIIIRKRKSNIELEFQIKNIELSNPLNGKYMYSGFDFTIPLKKISSMNSNFLEIYDFYIKLEYKGSVKEKKLGSEEYDYFTDNALQTNSLIYKGKNIRNYLLYTPGGNFKIESYSYSFNKKWYLQIGQIIDRKLNSNKDIWLIGERPDTAQDTGYHFFKYCREKYPEKDIYYVINIDSPDYKNIYYLGNVVTFGSLKHFRIAAVANTFIGSHDLEYILPTRSVDWTNYQKNNRVFLQHGVIGRKKVDYFKKYYKFPFTLFCVSSDSEFDLVTKTMGYSTSEVEITGLSRFDHLLAKKREDNCITIIPTWRDWIKNDKDFSSSNYYYKYKELLESESLKIILNKYNVKVKFYPHYRMQEYIHFFKKLESENIKVIEFGQISVQELLKSSKLLITDYSSVSFDYNYMGKPVLFYHFDFNEFFKNGILRPTEETFLGEIFESKEMLIDAIKEYITNNFRESPEISDKKDLLFSNVDKKNNERIFNAINSLNKKKL